MNGRPDGPSPALLAAQRRLEEARSSFQLSAGSCQRLAVSSEPLAVSGRRSETGDRPLGATSQPSTFNLQPLAVSDQPPSPDPQSPIPNPRSSSFTLHPSLALAMLDKGLASPGRIWLLLRHLDREGQGWLELEWIQQKLGHKASDLRVCGQRQLRNLLRQGQDIFWRRDKSRVWLRSAARVAIALGVERLRGRPVTVPLSVLLGGIGQIRAHFYAAFHSGRPSGDQQPISRPITRATLEKVTHVPARTQRLYEQRAGVEVRSNIAVGERLNRKNLQERAWRHGRATFQFIDSEGKQGPVGGRYVAWRLPNSYQGPHALSPKGRLRKINHQIDLVNSRAQGNDLDRAVAQPAVEQLFHSSGQEAGRAYNRDQSRDLYWPVSRPRSGGPETGHRQLWRVLPAKED